MQGHNLPTLHDVSGVIHCHSTYSDGMEPIEAIVAAANRAGLSFLLMTDHDTLAPLQEVGDRWVGQTLLMIGCEITPRNNHYLAYGITGPVSPYLTPAEYTAAVAEQGGIGFLAHPYEPGGPFIGQNTYCWEDWSVSTYDGVEVWNYFSEWVGCCQNLRSTLKALVNWKGSIKAPYPQNLAKWDELGRSRRVVGIGGMDAHGIRRRILGLNLLIHPYERSFRAVRTHVLLPSAFSGEVDPDRRMVVDALKEGRCYFANHEEGDPNGFVFVGRGEGQWILMGREVSVQKPGTIHFSARSPVAGHKPLLRLLRDGKILLETRDHDLQAWDQGPGVYRVEAWRGDRGWIFSNPIYVRAGS